MQGNLLHGSAWPNPHAPELGFIASVRLPLSRAYINAFASASLVFATGAGAGAGAGCGRSETGAGAVSAGSVFNSSDFLRDSARTTCVPTVCVISCLLKSLGGAG